MPSDDSNSGLSSFPWPAVLALLAAGSGYFLIFGPVTSVRPASAGSKDSAVRYGVEDVDARLWQDPLGAVNESLKNTPAYSGTERDSHSVFAFRNEVAAHALSITEKNHTLDDTQSHRSDLIIMPVMISGGPYEEEVESRLRDRVAISQGLEASGFIPEDNKHIGYFRFPYALADGSIAHSGSSEIFSVTGTMPVKWDRCDTDQVQDVLAATSGTTRDTASISPGNAATVAPQQIIVPYEWWQPARRQISVRGAPCRHILVLWVPDDAFKQDPMRRIVDLVWYFQWKIGRGQVDGPNCYVIGPGTSDTLRGMVQECASPLPIDMKMRLCSTRIYSCKSAASESILVKSGTSSCKEIIEGAVQFRELSKGPKEFPRNEFRFVRTVLTDTEVVEAMFNELRLRGFKTYLERAASDAKARATGWSAAGSTSATSGSGVPPTGLGMAPTPWTGPDDIAIITEQDTTYARAVEQSFIERFVGISFPAKGLSQRDWGRLKNFPYIHPFTYLRGIDGEVPADNRGQAGSANSASRQAGSGASGEDKSKGESASQRARPQDDSVGTEGINQVDYLERQANQILDLNTKLQTQGRMLKAVAVLGSDVYDKLEILEALRPRLKGTIFITNQMDARYELSNEWKVTRNLLVFSGFGLKLRDEYQRGIPPFRDSYQTATYEATLEALGVLADGTARTFPPRVFEICRSGSFDFPPVVTKGVAGSSEPGSIHPPHDKLSGFWGEKVHGIWFLVGLRLPRIVWATLAMVSGLIVYVLAKILCGHGSPWNAAAKWVNGCMALGQLWIGFSMCIIVVLAWFGIMHPLPFEPISFTEGISTIPYLLIWRMGMLLSIYLIFKAHLDLKANADTIAHEYHLDDATGEPRTFRARVRDFFDAWTHYRSVRTGEEAIHIDAQALWHEYQRRTTFAARMGRCLPISLAYFLFTMLLVSVVGQSAFCFPARGFKPPGVLLAIFYQLLMLAPILLGFFVVDATRLQVEFIRRISRAPTTWPDPVYAELRQVIPKEIEKEDLSTFIDLKVIAERTDAVGTLIYYPFIYILLMILGKNSYFDDLPRSIPADLINGCYILVALYSAYRLPRAANDFRSQTVDELRQSQAVACKNREKRKAEAIEMLIDRIQSLDKGVFVSFWEQPAIRALLLPSGGLGIWTILQYLPH